MRFNIDKAFIRRNCKKREIYKFLVEKMDSLKKREPWTDYETRQMLLIIKRNYISKLVNNASYRNFQIFKEISKEMAKANYKKSAAQIRVKFKSLKLDYKKLIRNDNNYCASVRRHTKQHLDLLNAIFGYSDAEANDSSSVTVEEKEEEIKPATPDPLLIAYHSSIIKSEQDEVYEQEAIEEMLPEILSTTGDDACGSDESKQTPMMTTATDIETENQKSTAATIKTFKQQKRQSYHKVVENFTREWKDSQLTLIQTMEQQDQKYLSTIEAQCKRQEAMLREDRKEMEKILKQDREEMKSFFVSILQAMGVQTPNTANSSERDDVKVNV